VNRVTIQANARLTPVRREELVRPGTPPHAAHHWPRTSASFRRCCTNGRMPPAMPTQTQKPAGCPAGSMSTIISGITACCRS